MYRINQIVEQVRSFPRWEKDAKIQLIINCHTHIIDMNFKSFEGTAIFVDLDETLIFNDIHNRCYDKPCAKTFNFNSTNTRVFLRPYAKEFLSNLQELKVPIYILTNGITMFQVEVCKLLGIYSLVDDLYGRDQYYKVPHTPKGILIDNMDIDYSNTQRKLNAIGLGRKDPWGSITTNRFVKVSSWMGDENDSELNSIIPRIKKILES